MFRLRLVIAFGLMAVVIALVANDRDKLTGINWSLIPLAWLLMLASTVVKSLRWSLLVRQSAMDLSFRRLLGTYLVGAFFSTVLPSSVGGDAVRAVDTAAQTGRVAVSTSSVLIERGIGLLAIFSMGSAVTALMEQGDVPHIFLQMVYAAFIVGVTGLVLLRQGWFMEPITAVLSRLRLFGILDKAQKLQVALSNHLWRPTILLAMFVLSVIANTLTMGAIYLVLTAVRDPIPLAKFVPMIALATVADLIPISISALGVKESAYIFFLGLAGVSGSEAGVIAIIMRVLTWALAMVGGIVFMARTIAARAGDDDGDPGGGRAAGRGIVKRRAGTYRLPVDGDPDEPITVPLGD